SDLGGLDAILNISAIYGGLPPYKPVLRETDRQCTISLETSHLFCMLINIMSKIVWLQLVNTIRYRYMVVNGVKLGSIITIEGDILDHVQECIEKANCV
ncbi:hypothetical protein L9F63_027169, partial [Diploptera punctata]